MILDLVEALLRITLGGSLAVLIVLTLRRPVRGRFGARAAYALWAAVPLACLVSLAPPLRTGLYGAIAGPGAVSAGSLAALALVWGAGALAAAVVVAARQRRFLKALGTQSLDEDGLPLLYALDGSQIGPAVVGTFNPRIVLPANFAARYSDEERRLVLAHERAHLFSHHPQVNALAAAMQCLNWFNPLAHLAARALRIDQELAADEAVVVQYPQGGRTYAEAILKTQLAVQGLPLGCQWPTRAGHPLRQRIALLQAPGMGQGGRGLAAAAVMGLCLFAGAAAWAAQPPHGLLGGDEAGRIVELWTVLKAGDAPPTMSEHLYVSSGREIRRTYRLADGVTMKVSLTPRIEGEAVRLAARAEFSDGRRLSRDLVLEDAEPGLLKMRGGGLVITAQPRGT